MNICRALLLFLGKLFGNCRERKKLLSLEYAAILPSLGLASQRTGLFSRFCFLLFLRGGGDPGLESAGEIFFHRALRPRPARMGPISYRVFACGRAVTSFQGWCRASLRS